MSSPSPALPDPFLMNDGKRVRTADDWAARRSEIKELVAQHEFGRMPPPPGAVHACLRDEEPEFGGAAVRKTLELRIEGDKPLRMGLVLTLPTGERRHPVIVRNFRAQRAGRPRSVIPREIAETAVRRGYALAEYLSTDLQADETTDPGPARLAYPDWDWGTIAVWAWGGMRVVDYLLTLPDVDGRRIVVTGHSRGGKTALLTGGLDERIAATVPNGCGGGGFQCWRHPIRPDDVGGVNRHESVAVMSRKRPYWFHPGLAPFEENVAALPMDQHFLAALVAPRGLCAVECMDDSCATPLAVQRTYQAARTVYAWTGAAGCLGVYFRAQGGHGQGAEDWAALLDFADLHLFGRTPASGRVFDQIPYPDAYQGFDWQAPSTGGS